MLPLSLLRAAMGHPMVGASPSLRGSHRPAAPSRVRVCAGEQLVELKSGETYNGNLEKCDNWMNLNLREVICTSRVREHAIALSRAAPIAQLSFSRGRG